MSFNLIRPLNQAVLIMYIFTQGLSFKQVIYVMVPIYCLLEIGRSVSFVTLRELNSNQLIRCCSVLLLLTIFITTSFYYSMLNNMQMFYMNSQSKSYFQNLLKQFDMVDEGLLVFKSLDVGRPKA